MRGGLVEWLSEGQEAAAEARHGRGGFPCLPKVLALGEKPIARPVSSLPGLACLLFPKKEDSGSPWAGGGSRGCCYSNFVVDAWGGKCCAWHSAVQGLTWVRGCLGRGWGCVIASDPYLAQCFPWCPAKISSRRGWGQPRGATASPHVCCQG